MIATEEDMIEWTSEGEQKLQYARRRGYFVKNNRRIMGYELSGHKCVKQGGTTGYDFYSCPGKKLQGQDFLFFMGGYFMTILSKLWRRCAD